MAVVLFAGALMVSGCYGPFNLTRRLHNWNGQVGGRWSNEVVFLVMGILLPVYNLAMFGDAIIFNSIEFWTGDNPIDPPMTAQTQRKTFAQGNQTVMLERTDSAASRRMNVQILENDQLVKQFALEATLDGPTVVKDASGAIVGSAQTLPDGTLVLYDAEGRETARHSPKDMDRVAKKMSAASTRQ